MSERIPPGSDFMASLRAYLEPPKFPDLSGKLAKPITVQQAEASVRRIWRAHGLKPHRVQTFKISNDPAFAEKLEDIVGLYLNPPEPALVLCA